MQNPRGLDARQGLALCAPPAPNPAQRFRPLMKAKAHCLSLEASHIVLMSSDQMPAELRVADFFSHIDMVFLTAVLR
jgi:hypothetical protein